MDKCQANTLSNFTVNSSSKRKPELINTKSIQDTVQREVINPKILSKIKRTRANKIMKVLKITKILSSLPASTLVIIRNRKQQLPKLQKNQSNKQFQPRKTFKKIKRICMFQRMISQTNKNSKNKRRMINNQNRVIIACKMMKILKSVSI